MLLLKLSKIQHVFSCSQIQKNYPHRFAGLTKQILDMVQIKLFLQKQTSMLISTQGLHLLDPMVLESQHLSKLFVESLSFRMVTEEFTIAFALVYSLSITWTCLIFVYQQLSNYLSNIQRSMLISSVRILEVSESQAIWLFVQCTSYQVVRRVEFRSP